MSWLNIYYPTNNIQVTYEEPTDTPDESQIELISESPSETPSETTNENTNITSQYVFHLVEVFERSYFNDEYFSPNTKKKILTHNSQDYFTTYKPIPFIIKNDIKMYESSDYKFNPPIYGDIIFNNLSANTVGIIITAINISILSILTLHPPIFSVLINTIIFNRLL